MKIRNSKGKMVTVAKKDEAKVRNHIKQGNHKELSKMYDSDSDNDSIGSDVDMNEMKYGGIHIKKSHKGLLHKNLGIPEGQKIPKSKLKVKPGDSAALKKRKVFAQNFAKEDGGSINNDYLMKYGGLKRYDFGGGEINLNQDQQNGSNNLWNNPYTLGDYTGGLNPAPAYQTAPSQDILNQDNYFAPGNSTNPAKQRKPINLSGYDPSYIFTNSSGNHFGDAIKGANQMAWGLAKGIPDLFGTINNNRNVNNYENNQQFNQLDGTYQNQYMHHNSVYGDMRNPAVTQRAYGGMMPFGGRMKYGLGGMPEDVNDFKTSRDNANAELEGANSSSKNGEGIQTPQGLVGNISGATHDMGGESMNLPEDSKVFSEKLKFQFKPKSKPKSFAAEVKQYSTEKDMEVLNDPNTDKITKLTANLNIKQKTAKSDELFALQEQKKAEGHFGEDIQQKTMEDYGMYGGKMPFGGTMKYPQGGLLAAHNPESSGSGLQTPTNVNLHNPRLTQDNWNTITQSWAEMAKNDGIQFKEPKDLQEYMYDRSLDTPQGQDALRRMWKYFGTTAQGLKNYPNYAKKDFNNLSEQDLKDLRGAFIDNKLERRAVMPIITPDAKVVTPTGEQLKSDGTVNNEKPLQYNQVQTNNRWMPTVMPLPIPDLYGKYPHNTSQLQPHLIDYRNPDIEPQLNEINRSTRGLSRFLGNNPAGVSQAAQLQINALNAQNQAFGNYFNTTQVGKLGIDEYNSRELGRIDQANLQERTRFGDAVEKNAGAISQQQLVDRTGMEDNYWLANHYNDTKNFTQEHFSPSSYYGGNPNFTYGTYNAGMNPNDNTNDETRTETYIDPKTGKQVTRNWVIKKESKKFGGKVKIKPNLKKIKK